MRTLIVGGLPNFVKNSLISNLRDIGLETEWHISDGKKGSIPSDCECVLVLKEMAGGRVVKTYKDEAKRMGIRHAEIPHKFAQARQTLLTTGIITQADLDCADTRRVAKPTVTNTATIGQKKDAAVQYLFERLMDGLTRTSRDMIRAHIKKVFGPRVGVNDNTVREARAAAAVLYEEHQAEATNNIDSMVRDSIHMLIDDYPESTIDAIYSFLINLYEFDNLDAFLRDQNVTKNDLVNLANTVRTELFTQWSKPYQKKTGEEQQALVAKRGAYMLRLCRRFFAEKGHLPPWETMNANCKRIFGTIPPVKEVKFARQAAQAEFPQVEPVPQSSTVVPEAKPENSTATPQTPLLAKPTPWFRRVKSNYSPERVQIQLTNGIEAYNKLSPGEVAIVTSWMSEVLIRCKGSKAQRPSKGIRKIFNSHPPVTTNTIMFLCWHFLNDDALQPFQYRELYGVLTGKGMGHYVAILVNRYVSHEGKFIEPVVPIYADEAPTETVEIPTETVEIPQVDEELPPEAGEPVVQMADISSLEAKMGQIVSSQQATAAQLVAAQQAQTDQVLTALMASRTEATEQAMKTRQALDAVGQIVQSHNAVLVDIADTLAIIDSRVEGITTYVKGLATTTEANSGTLSLLVEKSDQPLKAGFNQETQDVVTGLLAYLQQLNAPALVERFDTMEERIITAAVTAAAQATAGNGELTLREIIGLGGTVKLGGK